MRHRLNGHVEAPLGGAGVTVPCPVLVGRAAQLAVLRRAFDDTRAGTGGVVFVVGEAGMGKSRLTQEVVAIAAEHEARVWRGRAVPGSEATAFRPFAEALAPVLSEVEDDEALQRWLPALGAIVPTRSFGATTVDVTAPVRGEAVLRVLALVRGASTGLLVLEDLHWADPETVAVVEHLSDNLARIPVLCVATVRSDEESAARDLVRRVARRRSAAVVEVARLNEAQAAAMAYSCAGGALPEAVDRAVSLADGVPFLVEEMLVSPGLPESFAEGVQGRLGLLSDRDRGVLLAASAFGRQFDWRLLATATGASEGEVVDALDRGVASQLLAVDGDGFRFRHALTAEAVFDSVTPPRRRALAASALAALDAAIPQLPPDLLEVAARLAERAGRRERAGRLHLALGEEALARGALRTAVAALERAAALLAAGDDCDTAQERLVEALVAAGRVDDALALGGSFVPRLAATAAAATHLRLAGAATTAARWDVARAHLAGAAALVGAGSTPRLRADLAVREAELALGGDDIGHAERRARDALDIARSEGLREQECEALQLLGRCARRTSLDAAERWFRQGLAAADAYELPVWRLRALHELGTIALLERSEVDALLDARHLAEALGAMATAAVLDIEIAAGYAGRDDIDGVRRHGEQAARLAGELGLDLVAAYGWMHVRSAALWRGDAEGADAAARAARAAAPGNRDIEGLLVGAELFVALPADDLERSLALATQMTELLRGSETAPPGHHRAAWPVLLALAKRPEAAAAIEEMEQAGVGLTGGGRGWLDLARAILAGRTDAESAAALAVRADTELVHMPMWRSLARRLAARAAADDGWHIPDGWVAEAESCLREFGHEAAADACRRLGGGTRPAVPPAWTGLGVTRREADVLALVIDGCSNREIADRLYLSVRTVEKHVESLLRKTATKSRTQLARVATTT
jgi:DNA-binding CsgD family transcriptional regulator